MEEASLAAPGGPMESSDELSVAAAVEGMSLAPRGSQKCLPEMPPGVGNAEARPEKALDVVEGEGIPATADLEGQDRRNDAGLTLRWVSAGSTVDLNDHPVLQLPGVGSYCTVHATVLQTLSLRVQRRVDNDTTCCCGMADTQSRRRVALGDGGNCSVCMRSSRDRAAAERKKT